MSYNQNAYVPDQTAYVPWRGVMHVEQRDGEDFRRLHLECGHQEMWRGEASDAPVSAKCCTCDPPTFRGQPFKHQLLAHLEFTG